MTDLRPHQVAAFKAACQGLAEHDRGQIVAACGSGKTRTGLRIAEALGDRVLVLLPSLSLLRQTLEEWREHRERDWAYVCVCSDDSVVSDELVSHTAELRAPATTDPQHISQWLETDGPLFVFSTYASAHRVAEAQALSGGGEFDLVIADEAHRTTGRDNVSAQAALYNIAARKRLFLTATPRSVQGARAVSMDNPEVYGPAMHRYPFAQAIADGVLCDYKVIVLVVTDDDMYRVLNGRVTVAGRELPASEAASGIGLLKAMGKHNLHRVVTFHSRIDRAEDFAALLPRLAGHVPASLRPAGLTADFVSGEMTADVRSRKIETLRAGSDREARVLTNARCLSEGVDVPTLDAVAFIDPRSSEVDIVQAVGRAIRSAPGKQYGYVLLPVYVPAGERAEDLLRTSNFAAVWRVLRALRTHDYEIDVTLTEELGRLRRGELVHRPKKIIVEIVNGPVTEEFAAAFDTQLVEATSLGRIAPETLDLIRELYAELSNYTAVARDLDDRGILRPSGSTGWTVADIRRVVLGAEAVNVHTVSPDARWQRRYDEAVEWTEVIGPLQEFNHGMDKELSVWLTHQRVVFRAGKLHEDRVAKLEALPGWQWVTRRMKRRADVSNVANGI